MAAVAFLIAGSGTASAEGEEEDIGRLAIASPDGDVASGLGPFRGGSGTSNFTSPSGGKIFISSRGSEVGASPDQDGGAPDYESNADYSSSTIEGSPFPPWVTGFGSEDFDSQLMNEFFSDSDHLGGSFVNASRSWSLVSSNLGPPEDQAGKRSSPQCSGDGQIVSCKTDDPDPLMTPGPGAESDGANQSWLPGPNFPGPNPQFGGAYPSALGLEMTAARNRFAMAWLWDTTQGTFLPTSGAYDLSPPVVGDDFGGTSNVVSPIEPLGNASGTISGPGTVPEIPTLAMLLIGLAGLALIGGRRLRGSVSAGSTVRTS